MTIAELDRAIQSKKRVYKDKAILKATSDYKLADLIGKSVARIYGSENTMPDISEVYPHLFDSEEIEEQRLKQKNELSAVRFRQFATSFNKKFNKEEAKG